LRKHLRKSYALAHQRIRPMTEIRLRGRRTIGSLDDESSPVSVPAAGLILPGTLIRVPQTTESEAIDRVGGFEDPALHWLEKKLDVHQVAILHAFGQGAGANWKAAAEAIGEDPGLGEKTRRRISYLMEHQYLPRQQALGEARGVRR
jgi:hypothetical protein